MLPPSDILMSQVRVRLLMEQPFFGSLAMRMRIVNDPDCKTLSTDGTTLKYNPDFVMGLTDKERIGVVAHEVMHAACGHMYRRGTRDMKRWNKACDFAINPLLIEAGMELPEGGALDDQYKGMSAEQIYSKMAADDQQNGGNQEPQGGDGGNSPTGDFTDGAQDGDGESAESDQPQMTEADWKIATEQAAMVAASAGKLAGGIDRTVKDARKSKADWRAILREFIEHTVPSDYSWQRPNRRYIAQGLYLPGTNKENMGRIVVGVDTSGSITPDLLNAFAGELTAILHETHPEALDVVYCDYDVNGHAEFTPDDAEVKLVPMGGGGTRFQPVFDWIEMNDIEPIALVYLTDLCGPAPTEPSYPVLWATPDYMDTPAPFGELVRLDIFA